MAPHSLGTPQPPALLLLRDPPPMRTMKVFRIEFCGEKTPMSTLTTASLQRESRQSLLPFSQDTKPR